MIVYKGLIPDEDGFYLVKANGILTVAECLTFSASTPSWQQIGMDYDVWNNSGEMFELEVICWLDLEGIAEAARAQE